MLSNKNVLYVFVRGKVGDHWCQLCHYQYAELVKFENENRIQKELNMEIVFVLPYTSDEVNHWVNTHAEQLQIAYDWKYPEKVTENNKGWMELTRKLMPEDILYTNGKTDMPFSILIDEKQELSKSLGLFTMFWHGSYVDQNIPTVYAVNKKGEVKFKYMSQNTFDRMPPKLLSNILKTVF